ncbi:MAG: hypothetical protein JWP05_2032 [Microbacteriaceae bacterium]|jgi:hypothetical protein|nr:hypothetical protein [Microbacteriaceae bacterium]
MTTTFLAPTSRITTAALEHRSPAAVFFLPIITFGIYGIVWFAKTRGELNRAGASIPTTWCIIVPVLSIFWLVWFAQGIKLVTGKPSAVGTSLLLVLLGSLGAAIVQNDLNKSYPVS